MPTTVQFRRGTTAQNDAFTGAAGELSIDTDKNAIRVHDNSTAGGVEIVNVSGTQTLTNKTLTSAVLNTGVSGSAVLDEDDMSSDSATQLATQQSIKAYVDSQVTAQDLDVTSDSGTIAIDLDSEILTIAGGTGIDSSATSNTVTLAIDSTVTTLTGTQTLTNKTLTSPAINSGTIGTALTFNAQADARFADSDSSNWVAFQGPATIASNITWTLPDADGSSGQALVTDGSGTLSWAAAGATISNDEATNTNFLLYFASSTTGALTAVNQDSGLTYNPSTGTMTAATFSGALSGNASTATALETARTIAGNSFDGTADITIASTDLSDTADLARLASPALTGTPTAPTAAANTNTTQIATTAYVQTEITDLIGGAPGALDTLNELAAAINDDSSFASTVTTSLGGKVGTSSNQALSTAANVLTNSGATISLARASGDTDSVTLTLADLGYSGATNANYITNNNQLTNGAGYTTNTGDITSVTAGSGLTGGGTSGDVTVSHADTSSVSSLTALTGANVVSDLDFDTYGHVTLVSTRTMTLADLGYTGATNANNITNNNQLSNGAGYTTNTGDITNVSVSGSGLSGGGASGSVTITSNATNSNSGSTIVFRDSSGNFSAGVITATTTAARYADLAERYTADADYEPGTVLVFGGEAEVTQCTSKYDKRIAGIVSTDPAFLMNESLEDGVSVGLVGRLPCKVVGEVRKGDLMVSSDIAGHAEAWRDESNPPAGSVIGKALENKTGAGADVIEVVVGKI